MKMNHRGTMLIVRKKLIVLAGVVISDKYLFQDPMIQLKLCFDPFGGEQIKNIHHSEKDSPEEQSL
jgi:hypothetical protein